MSPRFDQLSNASRRDIHHTTVKQRTSLFMNRRNDDTYREVYSTEQGEICTQCKRPRASCSCEEDRRKAVVGNGSVKVRRETKGRGGKTVTTISGLALNRNQLRELLSDLKRRVGTGGAEKDGVLEIQGDHCDIIIQELAKRSIKAKRSGG
jgi:translation initiation factor 1